MSCFCVPSETLVSGRCLSQTERGVRVVAAINYTKILGPSFEVVCMNVIITNEALFCDSLAQGKEGRE